MRFWCVPDLMRRIEHICDNGALLPSGLLMWLRHISYSRGRLTPVIQQSGHRRRSGIEIILVSLRHILVTHPQVSTISVLESYLRRLVRR